MTGHLSMEESALQIFNEGFVNENKALKNDILFLFEQYGTDNITVNDAIKNIKHVRKNIKQNKILRVLQDMINENTLRQDKNSNRLFLVNEEDEKELDDNVISDEDQVLEYFNSSVSGAMTGIDFSEAVKDIKKQYNLPKQKIVNAISKLIKDGKLQKGPKDNTIILTYSDEEENYESLMPSISSLGSSGQTAQPLTNGETPESLKAKGYKEVSTGIFVSADGKSQYILTPESKNNNFQLNKNMKYNSYDYERLCEEFEEQIDQIESFDSSDDDMDLDNTDGIDELNDTDDVETDEDEYTVTLSKSEVDVLKKILGQFDMADTDDMDVEDDVDTDLDDDMIDDEATDEAATTDLVEGEDDDVDIEEEDFEDDFEEDFEDLVDDVDSGVYTGAHNDGAPKLTKNKKELDRKGKPIEGAYKPHTGTAYDGSGRNGAPTLTKHNATMNRGGKPVSSKQTSGVGKSLFGL